MVVAVAVLGAGCIPYTPSVGFSPINEPPRSLRRRSPESVEIFASSQPTRPHVDIGIIQVSQADCTNLNPGTQGCDLAWRDLFGTLRAHAALLGCDAVSVVGYGTSQAMSLRAICVVYSDEEGVKDALTRPSPTRLPGEGQTCSLSVVSSEGPSKVSYCASPLVCTSGKCSSPYEVPLTPPVTLETPASAPAIPPPSTP
jgi:hypothetical protein